MKFSLHNPIFEVNVWHTIKFSVNNIFIYYQVQTCMLEIFLPQESSQAHLFYMQHVWAELIRFLHFPSVYLPASGSWVCYSMFFIGLVHILISDSLLFFCIFLKMAGVSISITLKPFHLHSLFFFLTPLSSTVENSLINLHHTAILNGSRTRWFKVCLRESKFWGSQYSSSLSGLRTWGGYSFVLLCLIIWRKKIMISLGKVLNFLNS